MEMEAGFERICPPLFRSGQLAFCALNFAEIITKNPKRTKLEKKYHKKVNFELIFSLENDTQRLGKPTLCTIDNKVGQTLC